MEEKIMLCRDITEEDKREICSWRYEGEYAIYNLPSYEEMCKAGSGFMNPQKEKNYRVFLVEDTLVGFVNRREESTEVLIGIGVRPNCCGKGFGRRILDEVYRTSKAQSPNKPLCLEVRTWNQRAIKCYQKAGFEIDGAPCELTTPSGTGMFVRMKKS
ncbi:MAG: GNAT family N-acetyltransferase [Lachnospiraceae bacterium]|nr:GNAT family N-acetyltransferase [Lachnospiraceae bacterium]